MPAADHHQYLFSPAIAARTPGVEPFDGAHLVRLLDTAGIQQAVVLSLAYQYGNPNEPPVENESARVHGAAGGNATPQEAWEVFRQLPLTDAEFRTIEANVAPYLR